MSNRQVDVDGAVDAGFTSYWPPDEDGETVAGTTADDKGVVRDELWPAEATDREELNEDQIAVIETAAHPATEFDSVAELSRTATPERNDFYAHDVLRAHWPSKYDTLKQPDGVAPGGAGDEQTCEYCGETFPNPQVYGGHVRFCDERPADDETFAEETVTDTPTADDGLSITEEYDTDATDDPDGPTAEYPPDAAGDESRVDAATLAEFIRGKPFCHDAAVISPTAVGAVRTEVRNDDPMTFHNTAERGWRVGTVVPREGGDTIVFVPIDAEVDE